MKVVSWNVRGASSPHKKYILWQTLFNNGCDVLCAVEHKCHDLAGSVVYLRGYSAYYAGQLSHCYSGVVMIIRDIFCPQIVYNDPYGRFLVMEVTYFDALIWLVGIYAPNVANQRIELWSSLYQRLSVGRAGLLMGDFNMCVDASQSTSRFSLMASSEQDVWDTLASEVLKLDVWTWLNKDKVGFTFQSTQYKETWSRLDRMYVMHDESFLPEMLDMLVMQHVVSSDHFPICFEFNRHAIKTYKSLLDRIPLRFNSSLLLHSLFDGYMQQIFATFSEHVVLKGCHAWDITLENIVDIHRMYGLTNAQRRRQMVDKVSHVLTRCNVLLMHNPRDEELLDLQIQLQDVLKSLYSQSYQKARLRQLQEGFIDNQLQSHMFFHGLQPSYARSNVVQVKMGDEIVVDPLKVIEVCISHFKDLIGPMLTINDDVLKARHEFYDVVGCSVNTTISQELDADFKEAEVANVLLHLPNGKSPGWDGITNEVFKKYANILKTPFTQMFQQCWDSGVMPESWKVGLIKLIPKVPSPESFHQWRPISLMGGLYKVFAKVLSNRLKKCLPQVIHSSQYGFIAGRNILHNILNVQMATDYAQHSHQEIIMVQLDLEKAYDHVNWSFLSGVMHNMGFGPRMSRLIFLLGQNASSRVMLNGGVTPKISLTRSVRQGCPLSPLLFAIATHPLLVMLSNLVANGEIVGLHLPLGG